MTKAEPHMQTISETPWWEEENNLSLLPKPVIKRVSPPLRNVSKGDKYRMFAGYRKLLGMSEAELFREFTRQAAALGYTVSTHKDDWCIAQHITEGIKPVFITAHADTVRHGNAKPKLVLDKTDWSFRAAKPDVIGADDRGGCLIIMELLAKMKDASVIFCLFNYEESGGGLGFNGSSLFAQMPDNPLLKEVKLFIGLDRKGFDEYVTYDYDNPEIDTLLQKLGYSKSYGTFSDVTYLAETTGTACVNLSAGFTDEHTDRETGWLYPVFRAVDAIPALVRELDDKVYAADDFMLGNRYLYENDAFGSDLMEFIEELYSYGETEIDGRVLSVEDVYAIVLEHLGNCRPGLSHKRTGGNRHLSQKELPPDDPYSWANTLLPF